MRVVLDTNVYVSAFVYKGGPERLVDAGRNGRYQIVVSQPIVLELKRILQQKFLWTADTFSAKAEQLWEKALWVSPQDSLTLCSDPDDNKFLEAASSARADYLVSGDKHLLTLKRIGTCRILTIAAMLEILSRR